MSTACASRSRRSPKPDRAPGSDPRAAACRVPSISPYDVVGTSPTGAHSQRSASSPAGGRFHQAHARTGRTSPIAVHGQTQESTAPLRIRDQPCIAVRGMRLTDAGSGRRGPCSAPHPVRWSQHRPWAASRTDARAERTRGLDKRTSDILGFVRSLNLWGERSTQWLDCATALVHSSAT